MTFAFDPGRTESCPSCGSPPGVCYHPPSCEIAGKPPFADAFDKFADAFQDECRRLWDGDPPHQGPAGVYLPEGVFPGLASLQNPLTREIVPVRRIALLEVRSD